MIKVNVAQFNEALARIKSVGVSDLVPLKFFFEAGKLYLSTLIRDLEDNWAFVHVSRWIDATGDEESAECIVSMKEFAGITRIPGDEMNVLIGKDGVTLTSTSEGGVCFVASFGAMPYQGQPIPNRLVKTYPELTELADSYPDSIRFAQGLKRVLFAAAKNPADFNSAVGIKVSNSFLGFTVRMEATDNAIFVSEVFGAQDAQAKHEESFAVSYRAAMEIIKMVGLNTMISRQDLTTPVPISVFLFEDEVIVMHQNAFIRTGHVPFRSEEEMENLRAIQKGCSNALTFNRAAMADAVRAVKGLASARARDDQMVFISPDSDQLLRVQARTFYSVASSFVEVEGGRLNQEFKVYANRLLEALQEFPAGSVHMRYSPDKPGVLVMESHDGGCKMLMAQVVDSDIRHQVSGVPLTMPSELAAFN